MKKRGMKIYFIHSSASNYNELIYLPVLRSNYLSNHNLMFANSKEYKDKYFKDMISDAELLVIELNEPDMGLNLEIKEALISKKPILVLTQKDVGYDPKYQKLFKDIISYSNEDEFRKFVEEFVKKYEGRIINGKVDDTIVLGLLN